MIVAAVAFFMLGVLLGAFSLSRGAFPMPSVLDQLTQAVATQADRIDALVETSNDLKARVADAIARLEQAINDATDTTTLTAILNALTANTEQIEAVTDELANVPLPTDPNAPEVPEPSEEG